MRGAAVLLLFINAGWWKPCRSFSASFAGVVTGPSQRPSFTPKLRISASSIFRRDASHVSPEHAGALHLSASLPELDEVGGVALTHHYITVADDVVLHVVEAGGRSGEGVATVCFLHGFPDFWLSWRRQIPGFVQAGYRVICPDLRGYAKSSKPQGIERYSEVEITADIEALREHFCGADGSFEMLVGHDWGAGLAWSTLSWYPKLAKKLAILNVPHPTRFAAGLSTAPQLLKSWYIFAFQPPLVGELGFSAFGGELIRRVFSGARPLRDPDAPLETWELDRYVEATTGKEGMTGSINWYRAAGAGLWPAFLPSLPAPLLDAIQTVQGVKGKEGPPRRSLKSGTPPQGLQSGPQDVNSRAAVRAEEIRCPVIVVWGTRDRYLGSELAQPPPRAVPNCRLEYLDATHWVHWDKSEEVTASLLAFAAQE